MPQDEAKDGCPMVVQPSTASTVINRAAPELASLLKGIPRARADGSLNWAQRLDRLGERSSLSSRAPLPSESSLISMPQSLDDGPQLLRHRWELFKIVSCFEIEIPATIFCRSIDPGGQQRWNVYGELDASLNPSLTCVSTFFDRTRGTERTKLRHMLNVIRRYIYLGMDAHSLKGGEWLLSIPDTLRHKILSSMSIKENLMTRFEALSIVINAYPTEYTEIAWEELRLQMDHLIDTSIIPFLRVVSIQDVLTYTTDWRYLRSLLRFLGFQLPRHKFLEHLIRDIVDNTNTRFGNETEEKEFLLEIAKSRMALDFQSLLQLPELHSQAAKDRLKAMLKTAQHAGKMVNATLGIALGRAYLHIKGSSDALNPAKLAWSPVDPDQPSSMESLAFAYLSTGQTTKTSQNLYANMSLEIRTLIGFIFAKRKLYVLAKSVLADTISQIESVYLTTSWEYGIAMAEYIKCCNMTGEKRNAILLARDALSKRVGLENRADTHYLQMALSDSLLASSRYEEAVEVLERVLMDAKEDPFTIIKATVRLSKAQRRLGEIFPSQKMNAALSQALKFLDKVDSNTLFVYVEEMMYNAARMNTSETRQSLEIMISSYNILEAAVRRIWLHIKKNPHNIILQLGDLETLKVPLATITESMKGLKIQLQTMAHHRQNESVYKHLHPIWTPTEETGFAIAPPYPYFKFISMSDLTNDNSDSAAPAQVTSTAQTRSTIATIDFQPDQAPPSGNTPPSPPNIARPRPATAERVRLEIDDRLYIFKYSPSHESWRKKIILTCDGGGIRGYASLILIRELMICIGTIEQSLAYGEKHTSSFAPYNQQQQPRTRTAGIEGAYVEQYLPCHYFDSMMGVGTGGIIATMLSRWRMTVTECLEQFEDIGRKMFYTPRTFSILGWPSSKHSEQPLTYALKKLALSQIPKVTNFGTSIFVMFPAPPDLCQTVVVAIQSGKITTTDQLVPREQDEPYLFRSYRPAQLIDINKQYPPRNWRSPNNYEIWEVCRATTAAPTFFPPQKLGDEEYYDGIVSNLTFEALRETGSLYENCKRTVVSFSCGKPPLSSKSRRRYSHFNTLGESLTLSEMAYREVEDRGREAGWTASELEYFGLNIVTLENVELNEMKEQRDDGHGGKCTTLEYIAKCTMAQLAKPGLRQNLVQLANILVSQRRDRIRDDIDRWERFACCTFYKCCENDCHRTPLAEHVFAMRREMEEHLVNVHRCTAAELGVKVAKCRRVPESHSGPY